MKTFYIASSSDKENICSVRALAAELAQQFGMRWALDWTQHANFSHEKKEDPAKAQDPAAAVADVEAAVNTDLFIFMVTERISRGAHIELGARLGAGKEAQIILCGNEPYFFYHHPLAQLWMTELVFLDGFYFGDLREKMSVEEFLDADPMDSMGCAECDVPAGTPCKDDCPSKEDVL